MGGVDGFAVGEAGAGPVGEDLLDEENVGEAAVAERLQDPEAVVVDPHIAAGVSGVVQSVEARE